MKILALAVALGCASLTGGTAHVWQAAPQARYYDSYPPEPAAPAKAGPAQGHCLEALATGRHAIRVVTGVNYNCSKGVWT